MNKAFTNITVAHMADYGSPYGGNFIVSLIHLYQECQKHNVRMVFIFPERARSRPWCQALIKDGYRIYFLPESKKLLSKILLVSRIASEEDVRILHTHFSAFDVLAWLVGVAMRLRLKRILVIWHEHSDWPMRMNLLRVLKVFIKYRCMGASVFSISVGDHLRERVKKSGVPSTRAITVGNGIDLKRAVEKSRLRAEVLDLLNISSDKTVLLMFGWSPAIKGVDVALGAVLETRTRSQDQDIVLVIVGREVLHQYVQEYFHGDIPEWVRIIPPTELPADYYQCADVFISPSRNEGFSYSVCEAMVNECPVIVSDIPGLSWTRSFRGVKAFSSEDSRSLSDTIVGVLSLSKEERVQLVSDNKNAVTSKYDVAGWSESIVKAYQQWMRLSAG